MTSVTFDPMTPEIRTLLLRETTPLALVSLAGLTTPVPELVMEPVLLTPPVEIVTRYPGHLHMNLLPRLQRRGMGSALFATWLGVARQRRAGALHVGVSRLNTGAVPFWRKLGFVPLDRPGLAPERTLWMGRDGL